MRTGSPENMTIFIHNGKTSVDNESPENVFSRSDKFPFQREIISYYIILLSNLPNQQIIPLKKYYANRFFSSWCRWVRKKNTF